MAKTRVLFLCTYNSARSQMAEGLLRHLGEGRFEVHSVGTEVTRVRPEAISVMSELGVDIAGRGRRGGAARGVPAGERRDPGPRGSGARVCELTLALRGDPP